MEIDAEADAPPRRWPCANARDRSTGQVAVGPGGRRLELGGHRMEVHPRPNRQANFSMRSRAVGYVRVDVTPSGRPQDGGFDLTLSTEDCEQHPARGERLAIARRGQGNQWAVIATGPPAQGGVPYSVTVSRDQGSSYALVAP
jgi:hypothetical protein